MMISEQEKKKEEEKELETIFAEGRKKYSIVKRRNARFIFRPDLLKGSKSFQAEKIFVSSFLGKVSMKLADTNIYTHIRWEPF